MRRVWTRGLLAVVAAMVATALVAAVARAAGVDLLVEGDDEPIPVAGVAVLTGVLSLVGVVLAAVLGRWSASPGRRFLQVTLALVALSLVPPVLWANDTEAAVTLIALHLVAAAVVVPTVAGSLESVPT